MTFFNIPRLIQRIMEILKIVINIIKIMKHNFILVVCLVMISCQEQSFLTETKDSKIENLNHCQKGMQRLVFSSPDDIETLLSQIGNGTLSHTRASELISDNKDPFVSLIEANKIKVLSSLTQEQRDSIKNDEDDLEFCPSDSVIADIQFAQLLNAEREIQFSVGNTFNIKSVKFSTNDGVSLDCGVVYGAIKYNNEWRAARITKYSDKQKN